MNGWSWANYESAPDHVIERIVELINKQAEEREEEQDGDAE
jgi:hypothetical protein